MASRKIDSWEGMRLLALAADGAALDRRQLRTAARFGLEEIAERHPGHSVEVRVPYAGAVQAVEGLSHRRGTPPNVVELDAATFVALAAGTTDWATARAAGKIDASGTRADIGRFFPLFGADALARYR
ncbi:sterol carrier family protein [Neoactinobaculum massilliense]|uniref:sterol carrier family protein n=1 Tax=Neoactinobaculum massilliense TaxID=2364794 RepID=UPI001F14B4CC|nr:sterol carrier family protein [Neoactinobaculum massilliense]